MVADTQSSEDVTDGGSSQRWICHLSCSFDHYIILSFQYFLQKCQTMSLIVETVPRVTNTCLQG